VAPTAEPAANFVEPCTPQNAAGNAPEGKLRLVIATGGTGGVYYPYGGGLARILTDKLGNAEATAEVTGGSVDNLKLIQAGEADIVFSTVDTAFNANEGKGAFKESGAVPGCTLAVLYTSFFHVVALEESGIASVADMKGKRIGVGSAGSAVEVLANRVLEAAGLDPAADITRDNLSVAESVAAMKDKKLDAFFWIGGLPTAAVTDLVSTPNLAVKFIDASESVAALREKFGPVYTTYVMPKDTYAGLTEDVPGIGIGNILVVNANMSEELAYKTLDTFFNNLEEVHAIHPEAKKFTLDVAASESSIPFHPGAIKFFIEKGVWKAN
jgi:hypothetical protein